jgi:hypothetical protein
MPPRSHSHFASSLWPVDGNVCSFEALLNNQVSSAREILESRPDSASHLVGLGIVAFLVSILSREEAELKVATETLQRAEAKANVEASARRSKGDSGVYAPGTEFKVRCCLFSGLSSLNPAQTDCFPHAGPAGRRHDRSGFDRRHERILRRVRQSRLEAQQELQGACAQ